MIVIKKPAKICIGVLLFLLIAFAGLIIEKFEKDAFIAETVATEDSVIYKSESPAVVDGKININSADAEQLDTLRGIGETMAQRIIKYREDNGPFETIEEIMKVSGIGESKFEDIKDFICVE